MRSGPEDTERGRVDERSDDAFGFTDMDGTGMEYNGGSGSLLSNAMGTLGPKVAVFA